MPTKRENDRLTGSMPLCPSDAGTTMSYSRNRILRCVKVFSLITGYGWATQPLNPKPASSAPPHPAPRVSAALGGAKASTARPQEPYFGVLIIRILLFRVRAKWLKVWGLGF